ncbi:hypothetical protein SAMN05216215_110715 [Saccharopolyspora shandongensis]|uniref:Uncharacterized protein n=1 Tax=Saccharopolyspora shandongensis TaxID=418495 RepID=A0A1H3U6T8_9PSEU|nr:hypothetical protein [Saccharopolyspora shandongensis]SDZ57249.1 hypothetical protein SAMN05216215_110715 [Saccharopolyspora shandongensis]
MIRSTVRTARKSRGCDACWPIRRTIKPGERYLECVASPDHGDLGNTGWWRMSECAGCAHRYGRGHLIGVDVVDTPAAVAS